MCRVHDCFPYLGHATRLAWTVEDAIAELGNAWSFAHARGLGCLRLSADRERREKDDGTHGRVGCERVLASERVLVSAIPWCGPYFTYQAQTDAADNAMCDLHIHLYLVELTNDFGSSYHEVQVKERGFHLVELVRMSMHCCFNAGG